MPTYCQIKKIHILKNVLHLDDETYVDTLMSFGVTTSKNLTYSEASVLIEILEEQAVDMSLWQKQSKKYDNLQRSEKMATPAQLRMIEAMWREISYFDSFDFAQKSLRTFLKNKFKTDHILFLTRKKANKVIHAIENIQKKLVESA